MNSITKIPVISVGICTRPEIHFVLGRPYCGSAFAGQVEGECTARISDNAIVVEQQGKVVGRGPETTMMPAHADCSFTLKNVTIGLQFHWQRQEDQQFVGGLKLLCVGNQIAAINVVGIEDYLASVISSEMSASASQNLLLAHAITSRSWLFAQLEKSKRSGKVATVHPSYVDTEGERVRWYDREDHELYDVCADDHCQRYQGTTKAYSPSVKTAVSETRGQVLTHEGVVCDARFSKSCGGMTEAFENVWEPIQKPYLVGHGDMELHVSAIDLSKEAEADRWVRSSPAAFCNANDERILSQVLLNYDRETTDFFRWKVEYRQDELADIIRRRSGFDFGQIIDLIPVTRGKSARLVKLKIVGTYKTLAIGKELEIRRTLSNSHLYSSAFVVEKREVKKGIPSGFILHGAGWGHGVGLCQIGAAVMGERGYSHESILSHYFPQTEVKKLY